MKLWQMDIVGRFQLADRAGLSHIPEQLDHAERLLKALS
jgi:hypothetical protein